MNAFWELIQSHDLLSLMFLVLMVHLIGGTLASEDPRVHLWARRIGGAAFFLYAFRRLLQDEFADPWELCDIGFRGLLAAGLAQGLARIVLTPLVILQNKLSNWRLAITARLHAHTTQREAARHKRGQEQEERRRQLQWQADAPERERRQREADQATREAEAKKQADGQRREALLLECQMLYDRHALALMDLLPRERFDVLLALSLTESTPTDLLEQRAVQVRQLITELVADSSKGRRKFHDLFEIAEHFHTRRQQLDALSYPDRTKAALKAALTLQEDAAVQEFLKS